LPDEISFDDLMNRMEGDSSIVKFFLYFS